MDEPFAALDEQTRMVFGEDLSRNAVQDQQDHPACHPQPGGSCVPVRSHLCLHRPRRDTIKETMVVDEPHPRKPQFMTSDSFNRTRNRLYDALREEVLKAVNEDGVPK